MTTVLASAADARYGEWLLNLVGSVQRHSDVFDRILVYDLGLTPFQRRLLEGARNVDVREVPSFVPHWRQGRTWKTWIWTHVEAETMVWLDAGITVLRPLDDLLSQASQRGYFAVSQGVETRYCTPSEYYSLYDLPPGFGDRMSIAAGILAFERDSAFYDGVVEPTFADAMLGRTLGFSAAEVDKLNRGLDRLDDVIVRDCPLFRHEQTILNIYFYKTIPEPHVDDLFKYAGWKSPHQHPEQVTWTHRRSGDLRFLPRVRYRPGTALLGTPWGLARYLARSARRHAWVLRPAVYRHVARRVVTTGRLRAPRPGRRPSSPT